MERRSNHEGGDGKDEGEENENNVLLKPGNQRLREKWHAVYSKENMGSQKPHAGRGWKLSWSQEI